MRTLTLEESGMVAGTGAGWDTAATLGGTMEIKGRELARDYGMPGQVIGMSLAGYGTAIKAVAESQGGHDFNEDGGYGGTGSGDGPGGPRPEPTPHGTKCTPAYDTASVGSDGSYTITHHYPQCYSY